MTTTLEQAIVEAAARHYGWSTRDGYVNDDGRIYIGAYYAGQVVQSDGWSARVRLDRNGESRRFTVYPLTFHG